MSAKLNATDLERLRADIVHSAAAVRADVLELRESASPRNIMRREFESGRLVTGVIAAVVGVALLIGVRRLARRRQRR